MVGPFKPNHGFQTPTSLTVPTTARLQVIQGFPNGRNRIQDHVPLPHSLLPLSHALTDKKLISIYQHHKISMP